jgi:hypothetical protein
LIATAGPARAGPAALNRNDETTKEVPAASLQKGGGRNFVVSSVNQGKGLTRIEKRCLYFVLRSWVAIEIFC